MTGHVRRGTGRPLARSLVACVVARLGTDGPGLALALTGDRLAACAAGPLALRHRVEHP